MWLITADDDTNALRFHQRQALRLVALAPRDEIQLEPNL
jgi:hypothetical protein